VAMSMMWRVISAWHYLVGENLADVRGRLGHLDLRHSMPTLGWLGAQMLDILQGIHNMGYIHRDVKPSNVTLPRVVGGAPVGLYTCSLSALLPGQG
jgi:hypothetical protein